MAVVSGAKEEKKGIISFPFFPNCTRFSNRITNLVAMQRVKRSKKYSRLCRFIPFFTRTMKNIFSSFFYSFYQKASFFSKKVLLMCF